MTVKELIRLLPEEDGDLEVVARIDAGLDDDPTEFDIIGVRRYWERDTGEAIVQLECGTAA